MRPTLFTLGEGAGAVAVHSYGALIALGLVIGLWVSLRRGRKAGLPQAVTLDLVFYAIVSGVVGSRLAYVLVHAKEYAGLCLGTGMPRPMTRILRDCASPLYFWQGGLVFLGGAVLAAFVVLALARRARQPLPMVADTLAPAVALAHVFGRLGCFMVGCCYGRPLGAHADWLGLHFPLGSVAHSELMQKGLLAATATSTMALAPTQLMEAGGELILFLFLTWLGRRLFPGAIALLYGMGYGLLRFGVELFRGDDVRDFPWVIPGLSKALDLPVTEPLVLSSAQISALILAGICGVWYWRRMRQQGIQ